MKPCGILATQNGVAYMQLDEVINTNNRLQSNFQDHTFYCAAVPTYIGGVMTFAWGTDNDNARKLSVDVIEQRFKSADIRTRYYNPAIHQASFALPQFILDAIRN